MMALFSIASISSLIKEKIKSTIQRFRNWWSGRAPTPKEQTSETRIFIKPITLPDANQSADNDKSITDLLGVDDFAAYKQIETLHLPEGRLYPEILDKCNQMYAYGYVQYCFRKLANRFCKQSKELETMIVNKNTLSSQLKSNYTIEKELPGILDQVSSKYPKIEGQEDFVRLKSMADFLADFNLNNIPQCDKISYINQILASRKVDAFKLIDGLSLKIDEIRTSIFKEEHGKHFYPYCKYKCQKIERSFYQAFREIYIQSTGQPHEGEFIKLNKHICDSMSSTSTITCSKIESIVDTLNSKLSSWPQLTPYLTELEAICNYVNQYPEYKLIESLAIEKETRTAGHEQDEHKERQAILFGASTKARLMKMEEDHRKEIDDINARIDMLKNSEPSPAP